MNKLIVILASCCACGAFATSRADDGAAAHSVTVRFGDLDTTTWSGAAALYKRLDRAAHEVCADLDPNGRIAFASELRRLYKGCLQFAIANAVLAVDRPALTQYATARGVMSAPTTPASFANALIKRSILVAAR